MSSRKQPQKPAEGQESVWDYPRPPRIEKTEKRIQVVFNGETIADTTNAYRILETSHPPSYYIPPEDVKMEYLATTSRRTMCEWKGASKYFTVEVDGKKAEDAAWCYPTPNDRYQDAAGYLCFYASQMDACYVDGELVQAQEGDYYGGWITSEIVGPFKGGPGTWGW